MSISAPARFLQRAIPLCAAALAFASPVFQPGSWEAPLPSKDIQTGQVQAAVLRASNDKSMVKVFVRSKKDHTLDSVVSWAASLPDPSQQCPSSLLLTLQFKDGSTAEFPIAETCMESSGYSQWKQLVETADSTRNGKVYTLIFPSGFRLDSFVKKTRGSFVLDKTGGARLENGFVSLFATPDTARDASATERLPEVRSALDALFPFSHVGYWKEPADSLHPGSFTILYRFYDNRHYRYNIAKVSKAYPYKISESLKYLPKTNQVAVFTILPDRKVRSELIRLYGRPLKITKVN